MQALTDKKSITHSFIQLSLQFSSEICKNPWKRILEFTRFDWIISYLFYFGFLLTTETQELKITGFLKNLFKDCLYASIVLTYFGGLTEELRSKATAVLSERIEEFSAFKRNKKTISNK